MLDVSAAGVNWADTHQAENSYLAPAELPLVPGGEVVGTTPDGTARRGARRRRRLRREGASPSRPPCGRSPTGSPTRRRSALVLQGTTAWHLLRTSAQLREGERVVVHAAAGGVGTLAVQLAKSLRRGARRRRRVVRGQAGARHAPRRRRGRRLRRGGPQRARCARPTAARRSTSCSRWSAARTFAQSLKALAPFGRLVHFGQAAREGAPDGRPGRAHGPLAGRHRVLARAHDARPDLMTEAMYDMFAAVAAGDLEVVVGGEYPLADARRAHEDLRARTHDRQARPGARSHAARRSPPTTSSAPTRRPPATSASRCSSSSRCWRSSTRTGSAPASREIAPIGDGHSNVTYVVAPRRRRTSSCAARRGRRCRRAHDVLREARVLQRARRPRARARACSRSATTRASIGAPFYVMEHVDGHVITDGDARRARHARGAPRASATSSSTRSSRSTRVDWRAAGPRGLRQADGLPRAPAAPLPRAVGAQQDARDPGGRDASASGCATTCPESGAGDDRPRRLPPGQHDARAARRRRG